MLVDVGRLVEQLSHHKQRLDTARAAVGADIAWYPYDILGNAIHLDNMLVGDDRDLAKLAAGKPVADIGAADGDLAFALEEALGWQVDIIDTAAANRNGLRGARALRAQLRSRTEIHDIDLDQQFHLPRDRYGLVFLLGILYHLQNPYFVLREMRRRADNVLLSTRVARLATPDGPPIKDLPVAYLLAAAEANADPTNYWIFSQAGLERLVERTGWTITARYNAGDTTTSDPFSPERDERAFLLLKNVPAAPVQPQVSSLK